jgi:hypothetical protein
MDAVGDRFLLAAAVNPAAVVTLADSSRFSSANPTMLPPNPANDTLTIDSITSSMLLLLTLTLTLFTPRALVLVDDDDVESS